MRSGLEHLQASCATSTSPPCDCSSPSARRGNIARAGEQANIVGSAISKRLAQLEDQLGTPLLVRKRHGVAPTAAGQTLLEHARAMLDSAARIERDMRNLRRRRARPGAHARLACRP